MSEEQPTYDPKAVPADAPSDGTATTESVPTQTQTQTLPMPPQATPPTSGRAGRTVVLLGAAVLLAGTSGLTGALLTSQLMDTPTATSSASAVPDLDRSSLAALVAKVQPTVVSIKTGSGEGSGVVIDGKGDVLTNNHVVATANGDTVTVTSSHGDSTRATIVGTDPRSDLAVVRVADRTGLTAAVFGDSDATRVGDSVLALGSPLGLEGSVTAGIVSAKDRTIQVGGEQNGSPVSSISGMIQTDAAVNPGNSGGALVDLNGKVIGINSAIATSGNSNGNIGVGFAIPSNTAERVAGELIAGKQVAHPYLGVSVGDADGGALVQSVAGGSPADRAGLRAGDLITKLGDRTIGDADALVAAVQGGEVGDRLAVTYTRNGVSKHATVTLAESPTQ